MHVRTVGGRALAVGDRVEALFDQPRDGLQGWTPSTITEPDTTSDPYLNGLTYASDIWVRPDGHDRSYWFMSARDIRWPAAGQSHP